MQFKDWIILSLILIGAVAFRLIFLTKEVAIGFDEVNYIKLAASGHLNGLNHVLHPYWTPLYPALVALVAYIIPDYILAARLLSIALSSLLIVPFFFFVKRYYSRNIACGSSLLIAFFSIAAVYNVKIETEPLYSLVGILGIFFGWSAMKNSSPLKGFFAGCLFGAAYLARPEGTGFLIAFLFSLSVLILFQLLHRAKVKSYLAIFLLAAIGFLLTASPYLIYLRQATGVWTISAKGASNQQGSMYVRNKAKFQEHPFHSLSKDNKRLLQDEVYHLGTFVRNQEKAGQPVVKISIKDFAAKAIENFYKLLKSNIPEILNLPLIMLLALGLFSIRLNREQTLLDFYLLSFIIFFWIGLLSAFFPAPRYLIPLLPISFLWIARGTVQLKNWLNSSLPDLLQMQSGKACIKFVSFAIAISLILISSILPEFGKQMKRDQTSTAEWEPAIEQQKAGLWLRENGKKHPIIMAYNHAVSFYAGNYEIKESVEIPENDVDRLLAYARYRGAQYLVLDDRYRHHHPLISNLYEGVGVPPDLKLIYSDEQANGLGTRIYEIMDAPAAATGEKAADLQK